MTRYICGFIAFVFALSGQQAAASCVIYELLDGTGEVIKQSDDVIAIMVGDAPIFSMALPSHASRQRAAAVKCPEHVVAPIQDLYDLSCYSDQAIEKVAKDNAQSVEHIRQRCADLKTALSSANLGK